jgi:spore germination protein GerM
MTMTPRSRTLVVAVAVAILAAMVVAWIAIAVRRGTATPKTPATAAAPATPAPPGRKITARLFYVSSEGTKLSAVDSEVAYADGAAAQAQEIVNAQLAPAAAPLVSPIPAGTRLRALYLSAKGEAYVDLSKDVVTAHTGGTQDELLTIYAIVNALTANLPAVTSVQLLVDGKEVDTLAGHIDLRRPLEKNLAITDP